LIRAASLDTDLGVVASLFRDYAASLPIDLGFQDFDKELASLPGKYAAPTGALLIACTAGSPSGCVAVRRLDLNLPREGVSQRASSRTTGAAPPFILEQAQVCEMKRLYVKVAYRGQGLGKQLACAIIEAASAAGYREMRLDTLATMASAQALYRSLGFKEIAAYYDSPIKDMIFMALQL
jgi:ribosomal protein S18 acetylase RimI-like enzyme